MFTFAANNPGKRPDLSEFKIQQLEAQELAQLIQSAELTGGQCARAFSALSYLPGCSKFLNLFVSGLADTSFVIQEVCIIALAESSHPESKYFLIEKLENSSTHPELINLLREVLDVT